MAAAARDQPVVSELFLAVLAVVIVIGVAILWKGDNA